MRGKRRLRLHDALRGERHGLRRERVYTCPEARAQGYATACVTGMCAELLREGFSRPCFTYDRNDPVKRGDLYRKVGARPYGEWRYYETTTDGR